MSLNSKYIHTNLAIASLNKYFEYYHKQHEITLITKEYTINNEMDEVLRDIVKGHYTHIFASVYIWNVSELDILFSNFKQINHTCKIIFGGPEVSFDPEQQLKSKPYLDAVIYGEGEKVFSDLLMHLHTQTFETACSLTLGIAYKTQTDRIINPPMPLIQPLDEIPFPYTSNVQLDHKIIYYESSRGCPYRCSYCLSSASEGVRYLSFERVKSDLTFFLNSNVPQVKFVDRTFNAHKKHALPILMFLVENDNGITNFHFEITATLLDEAYFEVLKKARPGLFQFEVGIQTTHQPTMYAIQRPIAFDKLKVNCLKLLEIGGIHLHVDLIAGLPHEDYQRFLQSFDDVFQIGAHQLQLGFLKIIKGTQLAQSMALHGYVKHYEPPYELLYNRYITFDEITQLKNIERLVEYYHNSGKFIHALRFFMKKQNIKPSKFFLGLAEYFETMDYFSSAIGTYRLYELLYNYYVTIYGEDDLFKDLLKVDYYAAHLKGQKPLFNYVEIPNFNNRRFEWLKDETFIQKHFQSEAIRSPKERLKNLEFITLNYDIMTLIQSGYTEICAEITVIMFDYQSHDTARMIKIEWEAGGLHE